MPNSREVGAVKSNEFSTDIDQALGEIDELIEGWNHRLSFSNLALSERYLKGNLWIVIEFADGGGKDYRALLQRELPVLGSERKTHSLRGGVARERGSFKLDGYAPIGGPYRYDDLVFVENVEFMNEKKRFVPIPSLVWLESPD